MGRPAPAHAAKVRRWGEGTEVCRAIFGKAPAKVEAVYFSSSGMQRFFTAQYRPDAGTRPHDFKPHQFRSCALQGLKIFFIIKPQGAVAHIGYARRSG